MEEELVVAYWSIYLDGLRKFSEPVIYLAELIPKFIYADLVTDKSTFINFNQNCNRLSS
jgi:hypothetical protein